MNAKTSEIATPAAAGAIPTYLKKTDIAHALGISERTLVLWMKQKRVPYLRIGNSIRFDPQDFREHLLKNCRVA